MLNIKKILVSIVFKFFEKKIGSGAIVNEVPTQKLHKPVVKIF